MDEKLNPTTDGPKPAPPFSAAFSLIELLMVISIIVILMVVAVPAVSSIATGTNLERAGQTVADSIGLARQEAVAKNREVQVAFLQMPDEAGQEAWRGIQIWRIDNSTNGFVTNPVTKLLPLPHGIVIASNATSPLLNNAPLSGTRATPSGNLAYRAFRFRANGAVDTGIGSNNYLTVQSARDTGNPPPNFFTIQINPVTGKATTLRP